MNKQPNEKYGVLPVKKRIIVIGDLHGDYDATIKCLYKSGIITKDLSWNAGETVVIQMGDQIDRGGRGFNIKDENSDLKIINLFAELHLKAVKFGGGVYSLIGNHELMNVMGNFDYVSPMGINGFGGKLNRYNLFKPGGLISKLLSNRFAILKVGDWIFVHGGINYNLIKKYNIESINFLLQSYLNGNSKLEYTEKFKKLFLHHDGVLWNRKMAKKNPNCNRVYKSLKKMNSKYIVIGHTPQDQGINCKCKNKLWRVDTGMSKAFGPNSEERVQILEILNNGQTVKIHNL